MTTPQVCRVFKWKTTLLIYLKKLTTGNNVFSVPVIDYSKPHHAVFNVRCNIYNDDVSVRLFVFERSALWSRCMPGTEDGQSRAMLATARPSCKIICLCAHIATGRHIQTGDAMTNGTISETATVFPNSVTFHKIT